jgi:hypothetical protein
MAGLLDGQIAKQLYAGFRNKLQTGVLWRGQPAASAGLDSFGDPLATDPATWPCQGFVDKLAYRFQGREGVPLTDSSVNIFAQSLPSGVRPQKDDKVQMRGGQWWQLRAVDTDPATALWITAAFECKAPG